MATKYSCGKKNFGGAAYNIISMDYENSVEGEYLRQRDVDTKVRSLMRSKNIDSRSNVGYNLLNGSPRQSVEVPIHKYYNPDGSASYMNQRKELVKNGSLVISPHRGFVGPQGFHGGSQANFKKIDPQQQSQRMLLPPNMSVQKGMNRYSSQQDLQLKPQQAVY